MIQQPIPSILSFLLNACGEATGGSRQVRICNALERLLPGKGLCHDVASFNNQGIVKAPYTSTGGILCRPVMGSQKSQKNCKPRASVYVEQIQVSTRRGRRRRRMRG